MVLNFPKKKDTYLKYISGRGCTVMTNEVASEFHVDPPAITKILAGLEDAGYITHVPYQGVCLTEAGRHHGYFLIKRHRILSPARVRYGLSVEHACRGVTRPGSLVSRDAIDTMCRAMGHPRQGVCGEFTHDDGCIGDTGPENGRNMA